MNKKQYNKKNQGFTLIEIMVSVAIFTIVITTGIGALVSIVGTYDTTQKQKKVHDGLNYALESMTREIRLGRDYFANASDSGGNRLDPPQDGAGSSLGFHAADDRGYVVYFVNANGALTENRNGVYHTLTDESQLEVKELEFRIIGTAPASSGDNQQPLVFIRIKASAQGSERDTVIQSLVSQRTLDV